MVAKKKFDATMKKYNQIKTEFDAKTEEFYKTKMGNMVLKIEKEL